MNEIAEDIEISVPRCPKCKSRKFMAICLETHEIAHSIVNGIAVESWVTGALPEREVSYGECACGHKWRFRDKWAV